MKYLILSMRKFLESMVCYLLLQKGARDFVIYSDDGDRYRSFFIPNALAESEVNDGKIEL